MKDTPSFERLIFEIDETHENAETYLVYESYEIYICTRVYNSYGYMDM